MLWFGLPSNNKGNNQMNPQAKYQIQNEQDRPFKFATKTKGRIHDNLEALRMGPLPAPSKRRVSDHILKMRQAGILIETEMRPSAPHTIVCIL